MDAGEVITALGGVLVLLPFAHQLLQRTQLPISSGIWALWAAGLACVAGYFQAHPDVGHRRHHHVITNIVHVPLAIQIILPLAAEASWMCLLLDRFVTNKFSVGKPGRVLQTVKEVVLWFILPTLSISLIGEILHLLQQFSNMPSAQLFLAALVGLLGSLLYAGGSILMIVRHRYTVDPILVFVQMLGYFVILSVLLFLWKVVDWMGMAMISMLIVANLLVALIGLAPQKYKGAPEYELVERGASANSDFAQQADEFEVDED